ncbi:MAG: hypothetical protein R2911_30115 [Caldilineaceae bacterium]
MGQTPDDILNQYITFLLENQGKTIGERAPVVALCTNIMDDIGDIAQVEPTTRQQYEATLQDTLNAFDRTSGVAAKTQLEILDALAHLGNAVKPQLMNATRSAHSGVRSKAIESLIPHLPEDDLLHQLTLLQDRSYEIIRIYVASLLGSKLTAEQFLF